MQLQLELTKLGVRLRSLRNQRDWTLEDLAKRAGVSEAYLSRLEGGDRQPSLAVLFSLAQAFGVALPSLFEPEPQEATCVVVRAGSTASHQGHGLFYQPLSGGDRFTNLQPIRVTVPIDRLGDCLYEHDGEEWLYVLSGQVGLVFSDEEYILSMHDAAHFDARRPHRLLAKGEADAEIILVACAVPRSLLQSYL
ncbi:MAG: XRE family transcriptional regulator [Stenomitos rutilans HA7619-LM2]|nr:XRE family transcriptional regulator [Stenomitos rutilans HA7619-LM2]